MTLTNDDLEHLLASAGVELDEAPLGPRAIDAMVNAAIEDGLLPPGSVFDGVDPHQPTWFRTPTGRQFPVTLAGLIAPDAYGIPAATAARYIVSTLLDRRAAAADLDNARATTPGLVPVYLAMLAGPCTLLPADPAPDPASGVYGPETVAQWADRLNREALVHNRDAGGPTIEYPGLHVYVSLERDGTLAIRIWTPDEGSRVPGDVPRDLPVELDRDDVVLLRDYPGW